MSEEPPKTEAERRRLARSVIALGERKIDEAASQVEEDAAWLRRAAGGIDLLIEASRKKRK